MNILDSFTVRVGSKLGLAPTLLRLYRGQPPVILMYHGVTDQPRQSVCNCEAKHVSAPRFREQLQLLASCRRIVPLATLVRCLREGSDASGMLAITFDDGYLNNATTAAAILKEMGLPATFFLSTGFLNERRWLWNDRIEHVLHHAPRTHLFVPILNEEISLQSQAERCEAVRRVKLPLKRLPWRDAERQVIELEQAAGLEPHPPGGSYEFMTWDHARALVAAGFELGAHTVNHAILSRVPAEEAQREIQTSRDEITTATGTCSTVFCYPNGKRNDYNSAVSDYCRTHFEAALSAELGAAHANELFELRRIPVDDRTDVAFLAKMVLQAA